MEAQAKPFRRTVQDCTLSLTQSTYRDRVETRGSVSALSAGAYTTTLYVFVDIVKGDVRVSPTLIS